jgi:hypothetical protein
MEKFFNILGVFDRVSELRKDPLLADIYEDIDKLDYIERENARFQYEGISRDKANFLKDRQNLASDFGKAYRAAKQNLGA